MDKISYSLSKIGLSNTFQALENRGAIPEKAQFYICGNNENSINSASEALDGLVLGGWLSSPDNEAESERRVRVLTLMSKFSMAEFALAHSDKMYPYLHHNSHILMEFDSDSDSELTMNYSVNYTDGKCGLFTLHCQMLLGKDFQLDENKTNIYFEFEPQCPTELQQSLDFRTITSKVLDWLKSIFFPDSYDRENTAPFIRKHEMALPTISLDIFNELETLLKSNMPDENQITNIPDVAGSLEDEEKISDYKTNPVYYTLSAGIESEDAINNREEEFIDDNEMQWDYGYLNSLPFVVPH
ncbi:hypothetical protein [Yersinia vastinensis]|uniref:hypothetical protein n=1 Tax=Yersinia vastinensis TaxID=2890318 RepID=UPI0005E544AB|nr:hypothetical protein [Yersinia vastinensis]OVZ95912.1 hypothetical protein CBW53_18035 [Yersinia frederiksenii]CNI82626.1 Uncharacterised protein [Yersinia frederiksenii]CNK92639.1 Uncharacterised protein [Yersinia frederiksenii]